MFYNLTITGLSVVVALVIGTIEVGGLISSELDLSGTFWNWFENVDSNVLGFVFVAMFCRYVGHRACDLAAWANRGARWTALLKESGIVD